MDAMDDLYGLRGTNEQEKLKRHRSRRLITRRSEVQVLLPQPEETAAFQPKSGGFLRPVNSVSCAVGFKKALDVYRIYIQAKWRVAVKNDGGSVKREKSPLKRST